MEEKGTWPPVDILLTKKSKYRKKEKDAKKKNQINIQITDTFS